MPVPALHGLPAAFALTGARQVIESVNDPLKDSPTSNATAGTPKA